MKREPEGPPVATAADFTIPIEDVGGLLAELDDEPPRPRILHVLDELMRLVADAELVNSQQDGPLKAAKRRDTVAPRMRTVADRVAPSTVVVLL